MTWTPKKYSFTIILLLSWGSTTFSQGTKDLKLKIQGANQLFIEKKYEIAKDLWLEIAKENTNNSNINYKTGVCLLESSSGRIQSLSFLKIASEKVNKNYSPFDNTLKTAPVEVYFYLGKSYHFNNLQDSAIKYLKKFITISSKKHYLKGEADKIIQQCKNYSLVANNKNEHEILKFNSEINSEFNELNPLVSLNGSSLIFTSDRERILEENSNKKIFDVNTGNHYFDLYITNRDFVRNSWTNPKLLNISKTRSNEIGIGFSHDVHKIIFSNGQPSTKKINNINFSRKAQNYNTTKSFILFPDFNISSIVITENEKFMFFSSDKSGGYGGKDIWFSKKQPDNTWSKPTNMGPNINSSSDEIAPFLHPDGVTFFFSSNSDKSIGGYDVFVSKKNQNNLWEKPENLGIPINTVFDEQYFSTSTDGTLGFYSSFNKAGNSDLMAVKITNPYSNPLIYLTGLVDKLDKESLENNIIVKLINTDLETPAAIYKPNNFNGSYIFKAEECYHFDVQYFKLVTLSSGKVKESLIHEQTIKTPCESSRKIVKPILLPTIDYYGKIVEKKQDRKAIIKEFKERNKKYNFKEIISKENNLIALLLLDDQGNIVDKAILTEDGFKFELLKSSSNYTFKIENFPDSLDLSDIPIFLYEQGKETLIHGDFKDDNSFNYINNFNAFKFKEIISSYGKNMRLLLVDKEGNVIEKGILTNNGFKFELICSQLEYSFKLENFPDNLDLSEIPIQIKNHDEEMIVIGDFSKNNQFILPKIHFKKSFQLGEYSIQNDPYFKEFMEKTINKINSSGKVRLEIVGSASKIPSKKYSSNTALAKLRVEKGKKYIYDYLDARNISKDLVYIVKEKAIVSGPKYNPENNDNSKYFEYQYFSIWAE